MGYIAEGYKIMAQEAKDKFTRNRANILTGVSVLGTVATAYISAKDTEKMMRRLDRDYHVDPAELNLKQKVQMCWKDYIPTALSVVGTSAASIGSNRIAACDLANMTALYTGVQKAYSSYKQASREVLGEKKEAEVREVLARESMSHISQHDIDIAPHFEAPGEQGQLFNLRYCKLLFFSTRTRVDLAFIKGREMMHELRARGDDINDYDGKEVGVHLSEIISMIGFQRDVWDVPLIKHMGFNRGVKTDGSDDDAIEYYLSPGATPDGEHTCWDIDFVDDPVDMRLGYKLKVRE